MPATNSTTLKTCDATTPVQWRRWLARRHKSESEVWLVYHKQHTGHPSIDYGNSVDEALCFGWVDSLIKRLDDDRYARKFTPRKPDSVWSESNRKRYARLDETGRLAAAGRDRPPTDRRPSKPPALPLGLPPYIRAALAKHPTAQRRFDTLPPSHRRQYVHWIDSAKREETKLRRLQEAIRMITAGKPLGLK